MDLTVFVAEPDTVRSRRDEMAAIRLAEDEELVLLELGELGEPGLKEVVHVLRYFLLIAVLSGSVAVGETSSRGLIDENDGGVVVPRVGVAFGAQVVVDGAGTVLSEQGDLGAATRTACCVDCHKLEVDDAILLFALCELKILAILIKVVNLLPAQKGTYISGKSRYLSSRE